MTPLQNINKGETGEVERGREGVRWERGEVEKGGGRGEGREG